VTDFSWLCPDNNLSCWHKLHLWYEPRDLFFNSGIIIKNDAECFRFVRLKVSSNLFVAKKNVFGEHFARGRGSKKQSLEAIDNVEAAIDDGDE
jgi:hypothetical protein